MQADLWYKDGHLLVEAYRRRRCLGLDSARKQDLPVLANASSLSERLRSLTVDAALRRILTDDPAARPGWLKQLPDAS
jgi:hypothetical protein